MRAGSARQAASQSSSTPATGESSSPTDYAEVDLGRGRPGRDGTELTLHDDGALTRRSVLPGGVRVITESVPGLRSASLGMWFGVGSRDEAAGQDRAAQHGAVVGQVQLSAGIAGGTARQIDLGVAGGTAPEGTGG